MTWKAETKKDGSVMSWHLEIPWMHVFVHRHIHWEPDQWLLRCPQLCISEHELQAKEDKAAKEEAVAFLIERGGEYLKSLKAARCLPTTGEKR